MPLALPRVAQAQLDVCPIDWGGLPRRFMNEGELEVLIALLRSVHPRTVLEIGVNEGRTAKAVLLNVPGVERYIGVDVPPGTSMPLPVQRNEVPLRAGRFAAGDARFALMLRPRGSRDLTAGDLPRCDAVFIDGDHSWRAVLHDSMLAASLLAPGGIIVWHDYHGLGNVDVRDVLEILNATCGPDDPGRICHVDNTWLAFWRRPGGAG